MRLVFVHVDAVGLTRGERALDRDDPDGRGALAAEADAVTSASLGRALVAFATVEAGDGASAAAVRATAADAVRERAATVRVDDVALVPTALLSDRAATPAAAAAVWDDFPAAVASDDLATTTAGFGWNYGVDVTTKAHPFATTARTVRPGDASVGDDEGIEPSRRVVVPDGASRSPAAFLDAHDVDRGVDRALRAVVPSLAAPVRTTSASSGQAPPDRGDRARRLGIADRDPLAAGARRRPVGAFLRDALSAAVTAVARERDPTPTAVGGPRACDLDARAIRAYAATLGDGGHGVAVDDAVVLPDALGAATALASFADAGVDATDAPVALFDREAPPAGRSTTPVAAATATTRDSSTGLAGGARAPAIHEAQPTLGAALDAAAAHASHALDLAADCGLAPLAVAAVSPAFADANADWLDALADRLDAPVLVVDAPAAWPLRVAVVVATPEGDALATARVRLDDDGLRHFASDTEAVPPVVHAAPAGALDATIAAICDADAAPGSGGAPTPFPDWLAPTQVRLVPVAGDHVPRADAVADALDAAGVRVDVDDRDRTVGARLAAADRERVPRYVVVGDDERVDDALPVTDAASGRERDRGVDALAADVRATTTRLSIADAPDCPHPRRLAERLAFDDDSP